jgi:integrase
MIQLQLLTGMRPGEVVLMRTCDLDTSGAIWIYTPRRHKTEHRGRSRLIYLGPRAQEVVRPWLRPNLMEYLFSPREAMEEFRRGQRRNRKTPLYPSVLARPRKANPKKAPSDRYTTRTYHHAIGYGCRRANVASWHPNQLRHNAATRLRRDFGLDVARAVLGHSSAVVTELYADLDAAKVIEAMERVG